VPTFSTGTQCGLRKRRDETRRSFLQGLKPIRFGRVSAGAEAPAS
jgi:hypothetical protein